MENAMDCDVDPADSPITSAERFGILAVRVLATPFLLVAVLLWGATLGVTLLARSLAAAVEVVVGGLLALRGPTMPTIPASGAIPPTAARRGLLGRRLLRTKL